MIFKQERETILVGTAFVGDHSQVLDSPLGSRLDEVLWDTAETETSGDNSCTIE